MQPREKEQIHFPGGMVNCLSWMGREHCSCVMKAMDRLWGMLYLVRNARPLRAQ